MDGTEKRDADDINSRIERLSETIDRIDEDILRLINQRLSAARKIGEAKKEKGGELPDRVREDAVLNRLSDLNTGPLGKKAMIHIFDEILASSRDIQKSVQVAFLGPKATYTHIAALKHFGREASYIPELGIRDIFRKVEKESCDYGVVPVENSIEGAVNLTLDLLFESDLKICAEIYHPISHDLLSKSGDTKDVRVIYSHPQAFAQCREWLRKHLPEIKLEDCSSTAFAAQRAAEDPDAAAIASSEAARIYGLQAAASAIEDFSRNVTRFLVIGKRSLRRTGNDKTSIIFATAHVPGALYRVLQPIAAAGINMLKLESRPTKYENWSYYFYVDLEGHVEDPNLRETLNMMRSLCQQLKHLGSYPWARED
jgi:chorismate mutase/prephenate dehydratase